MKKKLMMVAVLLGALSLGACVDDNESASVTSIRNAKAQQLEALAALSSAQAEAELIVANAEAALKQAKAAYQQALANAKESEIERLNAEHAITLEKLRAEAEQAIAIARYEAAKYEQDLLDLATERVRELYASYEVELDIMYGLQARQIDLTTSIAQNEAGLVPAEKQAQLNIDKWNKQIEEYKYQIDLYNEYEGADLTELKQELAKAQKDYDLVYDAYIKALDAQNQANEAYWAQVDLFNLYNVNDVQNPLATVKAASELQNNGWWYVVNSTTKQLTSTLSIDYYTLNASNVEREQQTMENDVEYYTGLIGEETDEADASGSLNAQLNYWEEQKADKLEADESADVTFEQGWIDQLEADLLTWGEYLAQAEERLKLFNTLIASFSGEDLTAYDAAVKTITGLAEAYQTAHEAYIVADDNRTAAQNKVNSLNTLIGQTDVEAIIARLESEIAMREGWIVDQQNSMADSNKAIELLKAELVQVEDMIVAQQAIIDSYKQQIEAAINEGEEDTPAEEETPAA